MSDAITVIVVCVVGGFLLGAFLASTRLSFWQYYARLSALVVGTSVIALGWSVAGSKAKWWESPAAMALFAAIIGAVKPLTLLVSSWAKLQQDDAKQTHEIVSDYLKRALDPAAPYAIRMQLLRFLATDSQGAKQLARWASKELSRVEHEMKAYNEQIEKAQRKRAAAKTVEELAIAEAELSRARSRAASASDVPPRPAVTPQSVRAGFFSYAELGPLKWPGQNLASANIQGCKLRNSDFEGANLAEASQYDCDARTSTFDSANLEGASLGVADVRGSTFRNAKFRGADLRGAHVEGADFSGADFGSDDQVDEFGLRSRAARTLGACYDKETKWPDGFDPRAGGCILFVDGVDAALIDAPGKGGPQQGEPR